MDTPLQSDGTAPVPRVSPVQTPPDMPSVAFFGRPVAVSLGWLIILMLLLLEWALFVQFANRELLGSFPRAHDQNVYLSEAYETFDHIITDGLLGGLRYGLLMNLPQGKMMHLQAGLLLLVGGPNRLTALSINFFYFALLQCAAVYTLLWLTQRWSVAFLGLGLLLTTRSRFLLAGGMVDFRLDHIAFCLFGIFVCLVVRSDVFASKGWSLLAALTAGLLILFRYQAALTMAVSLGLLLVLLCLIAWFSKSTKTRREALSRLRWLLSAGVLIAAIILPAIWSGRDVLRAYYVAQAAANSGIWAQLQGSTSAFGFWSFYLRSLIVDHLGGVCCTVSLLMLVVLFFAARLRRPVWDDVDADIDFPFTLIFLVIMFSVPLLILTMYPVRNPVVANILITPALGLVMGVVVTFVGYGRRGRLPAASHTLVTLAAVISMTGVFTELAMAARRTDLSGQGESVRSIVRLYDEIAVRSRQMGWMTPRLAVDRLHEYLSPTLATVFSYERHGFLVRPQPILGNNIQAVAPASALEAVKSADFAIITDPSSPELPAFAFPFNVSMTQIQRQLHETAERSLVPIEHFEAFTHHFTLYMRPSVQIVGDSAGWITSQGLMLVATAETLRVRPNIELGGTTILAEHLRGKTTMKAEVTTSNGEGEFVAAPATFDLSVVPKGASQYKAVIHLGSIKIPAEGNVRVKVSFDKFFVPKEIGLNADTRHLVVMTPKQVLLLR